MKKTIAIIGDNFMQAAVFKEALERELDDPMNYRLMDLPFPDEPIIQKCDDPQFKGLSEFQGNVDAVIELAQEAHILITHVAPIAAKVFAELTQLELVAVSRGGPVNVDRNAAKDHNVKLVNTPGRNASAVAEFTVGALIAETRNISRGHHALMNGEWRGDLYRADVQRDELSTMTIGIVGYAGIGKQVIHLLRAFGSKVLVADPYSDLSKKDIEHGVQKVSLDELLTRSDAVSLHVPFTKETEQMIDKAALAKMKPGAVFMNTSRGALVDYDALYDGLKSKHLSGAVLETFPEEPVKADSKWLQLPNVTLTPHIAGASKTTVKVAAGMVAKEVDRHIKGLNPINSCL